MKDLVELMDSYWDSHEAKDYPGENGRWFDENEDDQGRELVDRLWKDLFIGSCWNPDTRSYLQSNGYRCWIGGRTYGDSFGILVVGITKDGKSLSIG